MPMRLVYICHEPTMTPSFTRTPRWSSDSPHAYSRGKIGINQRLDRVLPMFDEMKQQVERDSVTTVKWGPLK